MRPEEQKERSETILEENLKKALTELLMLSLLSQKECYIGELSALLREKSGGALSIVFPYGAIYRLERAGYVRELGSRNSPDGRRRQYFGITEAGRGYLSRQIVVYQKMSDSVAAIMGKGVE